jgi:hypothetical protein
MTDKEAFEVFDKYSDEPTRAKINIMLHTVGIDKTLQTIVDSYSEKGNVPPIEFISVMKQAFTYINTQLKSSQN